MSVLPNLQQEEWKSKEDQLVKARNDEIKKNLMMQQQMEASQEKNKALEAKLVAAKAEADQKEEESTEFKLKLELSKGASSLNEEWNGRSGPQIKLKEANATIEALNLELGALAAELDP